MNELCVNGKYRVKPKIGAGSFGDVYSGVDIDTGEKVAIKLEPWCEKFPLLPYESVVCRVLQGGRGIPTFKWAGRDCEFNVLVMQKLGPTLYDLFKFCNKKFTLKTVLLLADQMISRLEFMHSRSFVHRDLKPQNFLIGRGRNKRIVYVVDFGLALKYQDPFTGKHISTSFGFDVTGTACYASISATSGNQPSRRGDMESLGFLLMYFLRGSLPWEDIRTYSRYKDYRLILKSKMNNHPDELCMNYPNEFKEYFAHCSSLKFEDKPDYDYLRNLFRGLYERAAYEDDGVFDWELRLKPKLDGSPGLEGLQYLPDELLYEKKCGDAGKDTVDMSEQSSHVDNKKNIQQKRTRRSSRVAVQK